MGQRSNQGWKALRQAARKTGLQPLEKNGEKRKARESQGQESTIIPRKTACWMALVFLSSWGTSPASRSKISAYEGPCRTPWTTAQQPVHLAGAGRQIMRLCSRTIRLSKAWNQFFPTNSFWEGRTVSILRVRSNLSFPEAIYLFQWKQTFF